MHIRSICSAVCSAIQWQNSNCPVRITPGSPFPQRSNDDCLEGKRENYQVCSVQYCVQQLCTVPSIHLSVVCWLDLAFLWLYCVLQFICIRCSFLGLFFLVLYLYTCAFVVLDLVFFCTMQLDWLRRTSPKLHILCRVGRNDLTLSDNRWKWPLKQR